MPNKTLAFWSMAPQITKLAREKKGIGVMPTGVGKTTQTPQSLYEAGLTQEGVMYVSVPKRILAVELATRVAQEMKSPLGHLVGYQIRGESRQSKQTKILFLTEGMLRAKILANPRLEGVSVILFDEFHQRSLMNDFNVALVERAQNEGSQVAFLLLSATIDPTYLSEHFQCSVVDGSHLATTHPIEVRYEEPTGNGNLYVTAAEQAARLVAEQSGNILIFMPGKAEIEQTISALTKQQFSKPVRMLPLHGDLDAQERHEPFVDIPNVVTITIATDIVETGATLPNIGGVIDSGLARETGYDPISDISSLKVRAIAQDRIIQRKGRAGREKAGIYVGLFSEADYQQRPAKTLPEIYRVALRSVVLSIKALGLSREGKPLRLIDNPAKDNWKEAKKQLQLLGLVEATDAAEITATGRNAALLGCDPREAAMLLRACDLGCAKEMALAIAATQAKRLLYRPRNVEEQEEAIRAHRLFQTSSHCDAWTTIEVFRVMERRDANESLGSWCRKHYVSYASVQEIQQTARQLLRDLGVASQNQNNPGTEGQLIQAIAAGLPDRVLNCLWGNQYADEEERAYTLGKESCVSVGTPKILAWEIREMPGRRGPWRLITNASALSI